MSEIDGEPLIIDCDRCEVRPHACSDCVVSVLLGAPPTLKWDETERRAVDVLADAGMLPRLRLVPQTSQAPGATDVARSERQYYCA